MKTLLPRNLVVKRILNSYSTELVSGGVNCELGFKATFEDALNEILVENPKYKYVNHALTEEYDKEKDFIRHNILVCILQKV